MSQGRSDQHFETPVGDASGSQRTRMGEASSGKGSNPLGGSPRAEADALVSPLLPVEILTAGSAGVEEAIRRADLVLLGCFEGETPELPAGLPAPVVEAVGRAVGRDGFSGRPKEQATAEVVAEARGEGSGRGGALVTVVGLGPRAEAQGGTASGWLRRGLQLACTHRAAIVAWIPPAMDSFRGEAAAERTLRFLALAAYRFDRYRVQEKDPPVRLAEALVVPPAAEAEVWRRLLPVARAVAEGTSLARNLANTPPNVADPPWMAERAREVAEAIGARCEVLGFEELEARGMGGVLAVASGSAAAPRLVRIEWDGTAEAEEGAEAGAEGDQPAPTVALVGKGVTFDTGGISIKPAGGMEEMKYDKCGSCAVLGALYAAGRLGLPVRLVAYLPFAENMLGAAAFRPGDIVRCYGGTTVEIINTDAEGRMILADAMAWALEEEPDHLLEMSTLTGACVVALGLYGAALYSPDDATADALLSAAGDAGEKLWRMPLWPEYSEEMQSLHADLKNLGGRWGGAGTAAAFLAHFAGDHPRWAHLDIAGPVQELGEGGQGQGASGYGVALTVQWLRAAISRNPS